MRKSILLQAAIYLAMVLVPAGTLSAGEKKLMHCFAFTAIESATPADWQAFFKATDALPGKIPGLNKVWYGKLRAPLRLVNPDPEAGKKLRAGEKEVTGKMTGVVRQWGVCMEMDGLDALKSYAAHPEHKAWVAAYEKVRVPGTTTYDIIGQ